MKHLASPVSLALLGAILAFPAQAAEPKPVEIIAHRGASVDAPENTLPAIKLAYEQQADFCEIDVWVSKDGRPVVIHDKDTERVAGVAKKVSEQTWAELEELDVGRWKDPRFADTRIPTLEQALAAIPAGKRMFVEIKCGPEGVPAILESIEKARLKPEQTVFISFNAAVMAAVKKARPEAKTYWIVSLKEDKPKEGEQPKPPVPLADLIAKAREIQTDGLNVSASPRVDAAFVREIREAGLKLYVWTVDDLKVARQLKELGVDGITTNRPAALRKELGTPAKE